MFEEVLYEFENFVKGFWKVVFWVIIVCYDNSEV